MFSNILYLFLFTSMCYDFSPFLDSKLPVTCILIVGMAEFEPPRKICRQQSISTLFSKASSDSNINQPGASSKALEKGDELSLQVTISPSYTEDILSAPHQPTNFLFPKLSFGQRTPVCRSFQKKWFSTYRWLHYDENKDAVFCFLCKKADSEGKLKLCTKKG